MNIDNIDAFLKEIKPTLDALANRRGTDIGFNAFALVSDTYYRENFHSDILKAILDPKGKHGEGSLFLDLFRKFLIGVAQRHGQSDLAAELEKLEIDDSIEIARESDGRIDVEIKGANWVIIVENKINGACDQERQLPRYVEGVEKNGYTVKAIVYLTAAQESEPARIEWKDGDAEMVNKLLLPVVGYTEDSRIIDLVTGWLEPCELRSKAFSTRAVLSQYGELVRNQAGETMDELEVRKVFGFIKEQNIDLGELRRLLDELPQELARMVTERCSGMPGLKGTWVYTRTVGVLELEDVRLPRLKPREFAIDVLCSPWTPLGIQFFSRTGTLVQLDKFLPLLKEFDSRFELDGRIVLQYEECEVYQDIESFISKVVGLVDFLHRNRNRLEEITQECANKR